MDAGIKADPAYEQFVNAVLEAGFKAQYGIEFVPAGEQVNMDDLCEIISSALPGEKGFLERTDGAQQVIRGIAECVTAYFAGKQIPKNESSERIQDSEKAKGGLSASELRAIIDEAKLWDLSGVLPIDRADHYNISADHIVNAIMARLSDPASPPLEGATIVFTGNTNMPRDTHKGIAECLGAKVAGSVHKHTTLVVFGPGAGSKLDKANELCLPRMSEEAWLWLAARFGYGKTTHVSPYGKITSPRVEIEPKLARLPDPTPVEFTPPTIPSVETIDEAIRVAVREWRETNPDMGMVPPISMIAKKVHAVISEEISLNYLP